MIETYKLYNKSFILNFEERDWGNKKIHCFTNVSGNKIESVTSFTGVVNKPFLIPWATELGAATVAEGLGVVPMGYFTAEEDKQERKRKWKDLLKEIKDVEIKTKALEAAKIIISGKGRHNEVKEAAADIGTAIHELAAKWIVGKGKIKIPIPADPKIRNGFMAFMKFQDEHKVKWLESERKVYSKKHNYAGILDAVGKIGKDTVLIDFKSSNGLYPENAFQAAGYQIAYEEEMKVKLDYKMIIRFGKEDGEFEIKEYRDGEKDKEAFLGCMQIKRRLDNLR